MSNENAKYDLIFIAESIKAQYLYDLSFTINIGKFFRSKFENDQAEIQKVKKSIYKKST